MFWYLFKGWIEKAQILSDYILIHCFFGHGHQKPRIPPRFLYFSNYIKPFNHKKLPSHNPMQMSLFCIILALLEHIIHNSLHWVLPVCPMVHTVLKLDVNSTPELSTDMSVLWQLVSHP